MLISRSENHFYPLTRHRDRRSDNGTDICYIFIYQLGIKTGNDAALHQKKNNSNNSQDERVYF